MESAVELREEVLARLLDPDDPALQAKVLEDLLECSPSDPVLADARRRVPDQPWTRSTLEAHHGDGTWGRGFYHKYDGTSWALLHLSEVGAPMDHPAIQAGVQRLLATPRPITELKGAREGPFQDLQEGVYWKLPIACLTAHMALVLIRAGHPDHPVTRKALNLCRHRFQPESGFGCFVLDDSLLPACVMTVPKVLKTFLALPQDVRSSEDQKLIRDMAQVLKRFHLFRYVPEASGKWRDLVKKVPTEERRSEKTKWIDTGRLEPRREKDGWRKFSFPHSYNSDLLEVLLVLGETGVERDSVIEEGLDILMEKRGPDGMWKMVGGLNGKMHAKLDAKGKPSPWITYRALLALKRFGALRVPEVPEGFAAGRGRRSS